MKSASERKNEDSEKRHPDELQPVGQSLHRTVHMDPNLREKLNLADPHLSQDTSLDWNTLYLSLLGLAFPPFGLYVFYIRGLRIGDRLIPGFLFLLYGAWVLGVTYVVLDENALKLLVFRSAANYAICAISLALFLSISHPQTLDYRRKQHLRQIESRTTSLRKIYIFIFLIPVVLSFPWLPYFKIMLKDHSYTNPVTLLSWSSSALSQFVYFLVFLRVMERSMILKLQHLNRLTETLQFDVKSATELMTWFEERRLIQVDFNARDSAALHSVVGIAAVVQFFVDIAILFRVFTVRRDDQLWVLANDATVLAVFILIVILAGAAVNSSQKKHGHSLAMACVYTQDQEFLDLSEQILRVIESHDETAALFGVELSIDTFVNMSGLMLGTIVSSLLSAFDDDSSISPL